MPRYQNLPVDIVVDVRSRLEFFLGHLDGAVCIPHDRVVARLAELPDVSPQSRILLYCASGARSAVAAVALRQAGYSRVTDGGGMAQAYRHYAET